MNRSAFYFRHRLARLGNLGTLASTLHPVVYLWFFQQVYCLRFPHVGDDRHGMNGRTFDSLRCGGRNAERLARARCLARGRSIRRKLQEVAA